MDATSSGPARTAVVADVAGLVGLAGIVAGSILLEPTDLGFDRAKAISALFSWIPTTLPPAILIFLVSALEVGAGVVLARALRRRPFDRLDEALLQGFVLTVVKDVVLLGSLAAFGVFDQPILLGIDVLILVVGVLRLRPVLGEAAIPAIRAVTLLEVLVIVAWAPPVLLQLASPVVPFIDVLPNHVAPAEHLRTFGTLTHLTDTQSPIYGPSRILLGYTALLGAITTIANLPAGAALAGFILPSTLLVAVAVRRLAITLGGARIAPWALLVFAMTTSFARLGDTRATVIVLPLAAWVLATLAEELRMARAATSSAESAATGAASLSGGPLPPSVILGLGLGAAMLMHPVIGFLAAVTVVIVLVARPAAVADLAIPALATGAVLAVPQAATMAGVVLPPEVLIVALVAGIGAGLATAAGVAGPIRRLLVGLGRMAAVGLGLAAVVFAAPILNAIVAGANPLVTVMELSLVGSAAAVALRAPAARNLVLWAALAAGFAIATLTQLVPEQGVGLLGDALRFELPKTLHYWVPVVAAILAASGVDALLHHERLPVAARGVAVVAFVGTAALPIRTTPIDSFHLGEHRLSETLSIAMGWVQSGFWQGYPSSRYVVDAPRQALLDAVRAEIRAGHLGPDTPILHVAGSFQQWVATPLGVFDGVTETDVSPDAEASIHTVGGRLHPLADLDALLASQAYPYLLFEPDPDKLPPGIEDQIVGAGYGRLSGDDQGRLFRLGR